MPRFVPRKSHKVGLAPGSLVPVEVEDHEPVRFTLTEYDVGELSERSFTRLEEVPDPEPDAGVRWLNVDGLHDVDVVEELGRRRRLHPLVQEDVVNTHQRPKLESYDEHLYLVLKMLTFDDEDRQIREEQVSLVVGDGWLVSFQERPGDVFDPVRERLRANRGRIRRMGADYLAYALVDALVDHYFLVLEQIGDWVDDVEEELLEDPDPRTMHQLHRLKRELILFRKMARPVRELVAGLGREETRHVSADVRVYVRDVYDHVVQILDTVDTLRDLVGGMLDTYLSSVSNRMNEVMMVLTVMASVFIPLTFLAGVYGMNFEWMPELGWKWGYPAALGAMGLIAASMLAWFRRRGWI